MLSTSKAAQKILNVATAMLVGSTTLLFNPSPAKAAMGPYCQFSAEEVAAKEKLLKTSLNNQQTLPEYHAIVQRHRQMLQLCRSQTWPESQAIWLRLYPCDVQPGSIDYVLDRIVNLGYNQIHLEVFYDSQVLLPPNDNPTPWTSVARLDSGENVDLLQQAIEKAHQRGLKLYAWLFTMNFGYTYAQRPDRQSALARNAAGEDSLGYVHDRAQAFIDPYSHQAQIDYYNLVQEVLRRRPDGILFDYVRYPRGLGRQSYVNDVRELWIYGKSSLNALYQRANNQRGLALIQKYLDAGNLTVADIRDVEGQYPTENYPQWQGRAEPPNNQANIAARLNRLRQDLWFFTVAHAAQGIIDFLSLAAKPAQEQRLPAGAVFFPDGNRLVGGRGFDSRLQPWDRFPTDLEWHPMAYAICQERTDCITEQVKEVLDIAPATTSVTPALAGAWGKIYRQHLPLETQIEALRKASPEINSLSHFSYAWQEPQQDRLRKSCNLL